MKYKLRSIIKHVKPDTFYGLPNTQHMRHLTQYLYQKQCNQSILFIVIYHHWVLVGDGGGGGC
jgi:hypothetical protein